MNHLLSSSQLLFHGHRSIANQLASAERIKADGSLLSPSDRLHTLVSVAFRNEISKSHRGISLLAFSLSFPLKTSTTSFLTFHFLFWIFFTLDQISANPTPEVTVFGNHRPTASSAPFQLSDVKEPLNNGLASRSNGDESTGFSPAKSKQCFCFFHFLFLLYLSFYYHFSIRCVRKVSKSSGPFSLFCVDVQPRQRRHWGG